MFWCLIVAIFLIDLVLIRSNSDCFFPSIFCCSGRLHRGRDVCSPREKGARYPGGLRDGSGQGDEERHGEEHVPAQALEVRLIMPCCTAAM